MRISQKGAVNDTCSNARVDEKPLWYHEIVPVLTGYKSRITGDMENIRNNLNHLEVIAGTGEYQKLSPLEVYVITLEDRRFFSHRGAHFPSLFRELIKAAIGRFHGGASTIDMQFVRTCTNLRERTFRRKIYEIYLAWLLQFDADKMTILRSYLDIAHFGTGLKGAAIVSELVFGLKPEELTFEKAADVAAMLLHPIPLDRSNRWKKALSVRSAYAIFCAPQALERINRDYRQIFGTDALSTATNAQLFKRNFAIVDNYLTEEHGRRVAVRQSPHCGTRGDLKFIVLHATAGASYRSDIDWMCETGSNVSAHFIVGRHGELTQMVKLDQSAMHAGVSDYHGQTDLNSCSIGIELANYSHVSRNDKGQWQTWFGEIVDGNEVEIHVHKSEDEERGWHSFTVEQLETAKALVFALRCKFGPLEIVGHDDIAIGRKVDPGPAFPMKNFIDGVKSLEAQA